MKKSKSKVFCIGWHKTGTSTMGLALIELGYSVLGARLDLGEPLLKGDYRTPLKEASKYDALQDVPWAGLYKELDKEFPGSKFILTERNTQSWLKSANKHFGRFDRPRTLFKWLYGKGMMRGNEEVFLKRYIRHNKEVREYFKNRNDDFLVMDLEIGDGWSKLCTFLGHDIPKKRFPHSNKGKHSYNFSDKILDVGRKLTPFFLRRIRVVLLEKLGIHKGRNRFNNTYENKKIRNDNTGIKK